MGSQRFFFVGDAYDGALAFGIGSNVFEIRGPCFLIEEVLSQSPKMRERPSPQKF